MRCFVTGIVVLSVLFISACRDGSQPAADTEILVLCGGSMRAALEKCVERYARRATNVTILTSYGGSGELCAQIQQSGRGDIYICHDPFMPWAAKQGLIGQWATLAYLDMAIITPAGNPKNITGLADLARPGLRLGIGDQTYSTSGQIVKHMLAKVPYGQSVISNVQMESKGHQERCNHVAEGVLDVSIVWAPVAHQYGDALSILPIPTNYIDAVTSATYQESDLRNVQVTAGIIANAAGRPAVQDFYSFLASDTRDIFEELGFRVAND